MAEFVPLDSRTHDLDFDLIIWSRDLSGSRKRLQRTLSNRNKVLPCTKVLFVPAIMDRKSGRFIERIEFPKPIFFENKIYNIEFAFVDDLKAPFSEKPPVIEHRLRAVEDSFHYSSRTNSLRATLNTGNDLGWFKLELVYEVCGKIFRYSFSFEVLPIKMDMGSDLNVMYSSIDQEFPLWRYTIAEKTQQQMLATKKPHPDFLLLWFSQFEILFRELHTGLKYIVNSPHSRLLHTRQNVRMEQLKGKFSSRLEENISGAIAERRYEKHFRLDKKLLSVDTPENRFIKSMISLVLSKLSKIKSASLDSNKEPERQRLSDSFFRKLDSWQNDVRYFQRLPLFKEVGKFSGLSKESLVLQQKLGYSKVYKTWQQLKWYLEMLEGNNNLSLRSVSELYEVWCFLEIRRIILSLGFIEVRVERIPLIDKGIKMSFDDGLQGSFCFERNGIKIKLAHEPHFGKKSVTIKSWTTPQKPDIYIEAVFPNEDKIVWLFDAKYRIEEKFNNGVEADFAPDEAINQMHRYRDALIHTDSSVGTHNNIKSRPVFGAYVLYPGFYDQENEENPYTNEIEEIGIGAFSLLPSDDESGCLWLSSFLETKFRNKLDKYDGSLVENYYVEEAPRIPYIGTKVSRYEALVIVANQLGPNRDSAYVERFKEGEADFYHTKLLAFERQRIEHHVIMEAGYLAIAVEIVKGQSEIKFIYPILERTKRKRRDISFNQSGSASDSEEVYWLFRLGPSLCLKKSIRFDSERRFKIKLTSLKDLSDVDEWEKLPEKYISVLK